MAAPTEYKLVYSDEAGDQLRELDGSVRSTVAKKVRTLKVNPGQLGQPMKRELVGYRRIVAAGRYRVLYRIKENAETERDADGDLKYLGRVEVACLGIRREGTQSDVYVLAGKVIEST